jgi:hypothetical protein
MTEQEWLEGSDLLEMLALVSDRLPAQKLVRLTAVVVRCCWDRLDRNAKRDLKSLEGYLDGTVTAKRLCSGYRNDLHEPAKQARRIADWAVMHHNDHAPQIAVLWRCVLGNPFRPVAADPALAAWEGGMLPKLAQAIHAEKAWERLPILADALEEAGARAALIEHCREGPHTRGCWVLDLLRDEE